MITRKIQKNVPYSAVQMFDLVADIEKYPEFLPWCAELKVLEKNIDVSGTGTLTADMTVTYAVFRERFRSRILVNRPGKRIDVQYVSGPFRSLDNSWLFTDRPEGGAVIRFHTRFEFGNILLQATAKAIFDRAFVRMSDAFITRARHVYRLAEKQPE